MRIIGCDLHAAQQTIAMLDRENGEITERTIIGRTIRRWRSFPALLRASRLSAHATQAG